VIDACTNTHTDTLSEWMVRRNCR